MKVKYRRIFDFFTYLFLATPVLGPLLLLVNPIIGAIVTLGVLLFPGAIGALLWRGLGIHFTKLLFRTKIWLTRKEKGNYLFVPTNQTTPISRRIIELSIVLLAVYAFLLNVQIALTPSSDLIMLAGWIAAIVFLTSGVFALPLLSLWSLEDIGLRWQDKEKKTLSLMGLDWLPKTGAIILLIELSLLYISATTTWTLVIAFTIAASSVPGIFMLISAILITYAYAIRCSEKNSKIGTWLKKFLGEKSSDEPINLVNSVSRNNRYLRKEQVEEILLGYLGPSKWNAMNFVYLNRYRAKPFDVETMRQSEQISSEHLRKFLGVKELGRYYALDTHYGHLSHYGWLKIEHSDGAGFSPIFDGISQIHNKYPNEGTRLESISRRLAYLLLLRDEINYMNKRYDYEEFPIVFEFYTNKVEVFTTLLVDLLMILAELWCDRPGSSIQPGPRPNRFQKLFDCFAPLELDGYRFFKSINIMLALSAAITARHKYVHGLGPFINQTDEGGVIKFEIPVKQRFGEFKQYLEVDLYNALKKLLHPGKTICTQDPRFPEFKFELRRAKSGRFDYRGSVVRYVAKVPLFVKMLERLLWDISKAVIAAIV